MSVIINKDQFGGCYYEITRNNKTNRQKWKNVIPMELSRQLDMRNDEYCFKIFTDNDSIVLKKYQPSCIFCGKTGDVISFSRHMVCRDCIDK